MSTALVETNWQGTGLRPAACSECGQSHLVRDEHLGTPCPACGRGTLEPAGSRMRAEPPELVVPFEVDRPELQRLLTKWSNIWFRDGGLDGAAMARDAVPVLWPVWLVDTDVTCHWMADAGYDYEVESARESFKGGEWVSEKLVETRIRWEPRAGTLRQRFDNLVIRAMTQHAALESELGHLLGAEPVPWAVELLGHAVVRVPDLRPEAAWPEGRPAVDSAVGATVAQATGAQHFRELRYDPEFSDQHWTWLLSPVWATTWTDGKGARHLVLVHGRSGKISGVRLASVQKGLVWAGVYAGSAVVIGLVGLVVTLAGMLFPPLWLASVVVFAVALVVLLAALLPGVMPWAHNRKQRDALAREDARARQG